MGKYYDNNKLNDLSNAYASEWMKEKPLDWRSLRRAYRYGFIAAIKLMSSNGEIADVGGSL